MMRLAAALLCVASTLQAQATVSIGRAEAVFPETFTSISGLRALTDGRVIITDTRDRVVALLDFRSGTITNIGREGGGPGEWGAALSLFAMPGDSTLMPDPVNGRFFVILPDGKPGPTFRLADEQLAAVGGLSGIDAQGRLFFERGRVSPNPGPRSPSVGGVDVYRHDRRTGQSVNVGSYATPAGEISMARSLPNGMLQLSTNLPLAPSDVTTMIPLGDYVIVRAAPYRVDRIGTDGRTRMGAVAEASRVRVTQAEREAFVRGQIRPGQIIVSGGNAASSGGASRGAMPSFDGDIAALMTPDMKWPEYKPPFVGNAARGAWDGRVWVLRTRAHNDATPVYDVFGTDGRVVQRVSLAPRSRIVGFGRGVVYVARTDEDDLQHLERYRQP